MKYKIAVNDKNFDVELIEHRGTSLRIAVGGTHYSIDVTPAFETQGCLSGSNSNQFVSSSPISSPANTNRTPKNLGKSGSGEVVAPMPGVIVSIAAQIGDEVTIGAPLLVMEAMKMENSIKASKQGKISKILVKPGQQVENSQLLVVIE